VISRRYPLFRKNWGSIITILLFHCVASIALASSPDTQLITPANIKTFQDLLKNKPPIFSKFIRPTTIYSDEINTKNQPAISPTFINYQLENNVDFSLSTIQGNAWFLGSEFKKNADFAGVTFLKKSSFEWTVFHEIADFTYTKYYGEASFYSSRFLKEVKFYKAAFFKYASFKTTIFNKTVDFSESVFYKSANFQRTIFNGDTLFSGAEFDQVAEFESAVFKKAVDFSQATFGQKADFSRVEFLGPISFYHTILPLYLNLSEVHTNDTIDLTLVLRNSSGPSKINILNTDVSKIKLRYSMFQLYFPEGTLRDNIDFSYRTLLVSLKQNGYNIGYKKLATEFAEYSYLRDNHYILNAIDKYWWNYGFDKQRIFTWVLRIILFFSIINCIFYDWLVKNAFEVNYMKHIRPNDSLRKNWITLFIYNFPYAFLYTLNIFFGWFIGFFKVNPDQFKSKNYFVNLYLLVIILTGLVCVFFIFNSVIRGNS